MNTKTAIATNASPVNRSVRMRGTKWAAPRPIWCPAIDMMNVVTPNRMGAIHQGVSGEAKARAGCHVVDAQRHGQAAPRPSQVRIGMFG